MRKVIDLVSRHNRMLQALVAAIAMLALAACTTPQSPRPETSPPDSSGPPRTTGAPESAEPSKPSEQPPAPATAPAPEPAPEPSQQPAPPDQAPPAGTTPASEPPPSREVAPAAAASGDDTAPARSEPEVAPPKPPPAPPATVSIAGQITLDVSQVDDVDADSVRDTVIYFRPDGTSTTADALSLEITTQRKRLIPDVLVVPAGSTVAFPNEDDILHNVFSVSSAANFDLGLYGQGESKSHTFTEPGLAVIHCNVHHAMRADVLVVDTPFFVQAGADGSFTLDGIASAAGELVAWHPRAGFVRRTISLPLTAPLEIELALTRPRIPDHLDKSGQPYRPERPSRR